MKDLVIEVRGGNVVEVYSDITDVHITLIDWDSIEADNEPGLLSNVAVKPLASLPSQTL